MYAPNSGIHLQSRFSCPAAVHDLTKHVWMKEQKFPPKSCRKPTQKKWRCKGGGGGNSHKCPCFYSRMSNKLWLGFNNNFASYITRCYRLQCLNKVEFRAKPNWSWGCSLPLLAPMLTNLCKRWLQGREHQHWMEAYGWYHCSQALPFVVKYSLDNNWTYPKVGKNINLSCTGWSASVFGEGREHFWD